MTDLPSGTVTFLFTDLEGSTRLWEVHPEVMKEALARHDAILRDHIEVHGGRVVKMRGDGAHAAFATADAAIIAAIGAQHALEHAEWRVTGPLRVRIGIHSGAATLRQGDYFGSTVNRAARLMELAHGGQIVCSQSTADLARDVLPEEVGLVDLGEHRLRDLTRAERVFQVSAPSLRSDFAPLASLDAFHGNLPLQVTSFVGRDREINQTIAALHEARLVTLTGVGGVGKTRLALEVAAEVITEFADGSWLCELASVTDPGVVWETLASALGVQPSPGRGLDELVVEYLTAKRLLLVLDNCEHLLDAVAVVVDAVERRCLGVVVLTTSREGLAVSGEQILAVPSLGVPADDADAQTLAATEAVRLFCDRGHSVRSDFALTDRNASAVGVLCRRLDGIPLAIELAAARVRSLAPEDIVSRLDQRFKLLTHGNRAVLERHQTLRSTIDWSYDLLDDFERDALNRLSVFAGSCDLAAAEAVLGHGERDSFDVVDVLGQLVDKSLVVADGNDSGVRYRLLETIRQYAQERLAASGEAPAVRRRHADQYVSVAEMTGPRLRGGDQIAAAQAMARESDNFRAVLDWAVETPSPDHALRLVAPLAVHGVTIGYTALDWAQTASDIPGADQHTLFPAVASWASWSATLRGDLERATAFAARAEEAQAELGIRVVSASRASATLAMYSGDFERARQHAEEWVALARPSGDPYETAQALTLLGYVFQLTGATRAGLQALEEAVQTARDAAIPSALSIALSALAGWLPPDESDRALSLLDEAIEIGTSVGDRHAISAALWEKGRIVARGGDWPSALQAARDGADPGLGDIVMLAGAITLGAIALTELGHPEPATQLVGVYDERLANQRAPDWAEDMLAASRATLIADLGLAQYETLRSRGAALTLADAEVYLRAVADRALNKE